MVIAILCLSRKATHAQTPGSDTGYPAEGSWRGTLHFGAQHLAIVFHIKYDGQQYVISSDSPDQGAYGLKGSDLKLTKDSISFNIQQLVTYKGRFVHQDSIQGNFTQNGFSIPLGLHRSLDTATTQALATTRPQTPKPPFAYYSKEVVYKGAAQGLQLAATITMPSAQGHYPGVLLITGSGAQDRDETLFNHRPFAVLADMLTRAGYAVMRVDDRGTGQSTGNFEEATTKDFTLDAARSFDYLKSLPQIDSTRLGVIGHSEGGLIAEILAAQRKDLDFIILMAAPGIKISQLMSLQNDASTKKALPSASSELLAFNSLQYKKVIEAFLSTKDTALMHQRILDSVLAVIQRPENAFFGNQVTREKVARQNADTFFKGLTASVWTRHFMRMDPTTYISRISPRTKVLALNGSEDIQILAKENLAGIQQGLQKAGHPDFKTVELPGLNHLFQKCQQCTVQEYGRLTETLNPALLSTIKAWLLEKVPIKVK